MPKPMTRKEITELLAKLALLQSEATTLLKSCGPNETDQAVTAQGGDIDAMIVGRGCNPGRC